MRLLRTSIRSMRFLVLASAVCVLAACAAKPQMQAAEVVTGPYVFAYREVTGDYAGNAPVYEELRAGLQAHDINPRRAIGIFLDDPSVVPAAKLRSICGVIIEEEDWGRIKGLNGQFDIQHITRARRFMAEEKPEDDHQGGGKNIQWYPALAQCAKQQGFTPLNYFEIYEGARTFHIMTTSDPAPAYPRREGSPSDDRTSVCWPDPNWQTSSPEAQGMSSRLLAQSLDRLYGFVDPDVLDSFLITRHGKMILEISTPPNTPATRHEMHSVTKSVLGALVGIAVQKGYIKATNDRVLDFFPGEEIPNMSAQKRAMTVGNLLDMSSGLSFEESPRGSQTTAEARMVRSQDWGRFTLGLPVAAPPGTRFNYSNGDANLLSDVLSQATGMTALAFAKQELFGPLGITNVRWGSDPRGTTRGDGDLFLTPRDVAKIGYLFLRDGVWRGERLLPTGWASDIPESSVRTGVGAPYYSRLWWVDPTKTIYSACGAAGQFVIVIPGQDIVAVFTSKTPLTFDNYFEYYSFIELANELILPAVVSGGALPEDAEGRAALEERIRTISGERKVPVPPLPRTALRISGRSWSFDQNPMAVTTARLSMRAGEAVFDLRYGNTTISLPIGLDGVYRTSQWYDYGLTRTGASYASKGRWEDDHTFTFNWRALEGDLSGEFTLVFAGDRLDLTADYSDRFTWSCAIEGH